MGVHGVSAKVLQAKPLKKWWCGQSGVNRYLAQSLFKQANKGVKPLFCWVFALQR
jgi:hypothetical protein